ncbi:SDR family oxidoreductase [Phytoactinopolyspora endophytica]|uniref:SDR family oxidoreductase n=1 Tax=Phytoactinopolyspora endophytica TaxID=1642495 RepID=UPI00101DE2B8|nr:SDR family oxidoreductase [Phytoactinopolyspora endophytica]
MADLSGRRVVVTGAAGGIGSALAARLHHAGASLALTSRSADRLGRVVAGLGGESRRLWASAADVTEEEQVRGFFAAIDERFGAVDALVNVAGMSIPGRIAETSVDDYQAIWNANVTSAFLCCKHVLPLVDGMAGASIINISSVAGLRPNPTAPLYCTAKAALDMFSRAFALQVEELGVRVTTLSPGGTDTPFWGERPVDRSKFMSADDVVDAVMFVLGTRPQVRISSIEFEPFTRATAR